MSICLVMIMIFTADSWSKSQTQEHKKLFIPWLSARGVTTVMSPENFYNYIIFHNFFKMKKTFTLDELVQAMHEKSSKSQSLQPKQKKPYNFFWWHTICGCSVVTDQISFNHVFGKPDLTQCSMNEMAVIQARTILTGIQTSVSLFKIGMQLF